MKILVTGGAGFVGSHLVDYLVEQGHEVTVYDNLDPQVHGPEQKIPDYLNSNCHFIQGDILDSDNFCQVIQSAEAIVHLAAAVCVGQSMYEIRHYVEVNTLGTAILLDILANKEHKIKKMIVASSMSIYGEGTYNCNDCGIVYPPLRSVEQFSARDWQIYCPTCQKPVQPVPTPESKPLQPTSIYAISKKDQEEMSLSVGRAYNIPIAALRFFNIYGSRQALSNPYTGVAAIFSSRLLNNHRPIVFDDGRQSRDFIHVKDISRAIYTALMDNTANYQVYNVGSGTPISIKEIAETLSDNLGKDLAPDIIGKFRAGDIRHCYADTGKIESELGYKPKIDFSTEGIKDLSSWVREQVADDHVQEATQILFDKGLAR